MDTVLLSRPAYVRRADAQFNAFRQKVIDDGGTLETPFETKRLLRKLAQEDVLDDVTIGLVAGAYKAGKWYSFKGSDMDVVRATSGTRINRSGVLTTEGNNIVRADYNGGVLKGNNVEPSATNLLQRSEEFDNAYWTKTGTTVPTVTANAIAAPDGNTTADLLTGTGGISMRLQRTLTVTTGAHTLSFYVKNNTETIARFNVFDGSTDRGAAFTFASESFTSVSANLTVGFEKLNDGWYRIFGTYPSFGTTTANVQLFVSGTLSLYYWGAQLETGSVATSYIKTTDATATRNADNISKTGISSEIGQTEGAVLVECDLRAVAGTLFALKGTGGGNDNFLQISKSIGQNAIRYAFGGSALTGFNISGTTPLVSQIIKILCRYSIADGVLTLNTFINGTKRTDILSTLSTQVPSNFNQVILGGSTIGSGEVNDHIRSATIFNKAIPEATAIRLTT
jgi:hypothetical protein